MVAGFGDLGLPGVLYVQVQQSPEYLRDGKAEAFQKDLLRPHRMARCSFGGSFWIASMLPPNPKPQTLNLEPKP